MVKFEYKRTVPEIEVGGKVYQLPLKTAVMVDKINAAFAAISKAKTAAEQSKATVDGIALFIGEDAYKLYPEPEKADTDELASLWFELNAESNKGTNAVIAKYKK